MSSTLRTVIAALVGVLFSIATLEIDVFDYDNTFLDNYDSYIKVDCKLTQKIQHIDFDRLANCEITPPSLALRAPDAVIAAIEPDSFKYFYKPKLYLTLSSLLI